MRPLTEEETTTLFEKLSQYLGDNVEKLIRRPDGNYCFRLHRDRVYYVSEALMRRSTNISRDNLVSLGTAFGKFSKTGKFRLGITCLDYLSELAQHKVWVKPSAEMSYLYGNNIVKSGLARITEDVPQYGGVVVYTMNNLPMGFGVAAQSTQYVRELDGASIVVLHQADIGEYLRLEDEGGLGA